MKALVILSIFVVLLAGCVCEGPAHSKRTGKAYYPVKVCSIGDTDGSTCVEYAAEKYYWGRDICRIWSLDGHMYEFNHHGWAIVITGI